MTDSVFRTALWERRRSIIWWAVGLVALATITIAFVPTIRNDAEAFVSLFDAMPEGLLSVFGIEDASALVTAVGLVNSRLYTGIGPVIVAVLGIGMGVAAVAGEEDRGTLNLLMAQPVTRTSVILQKTAAAAVLIGAVMAALLVTLLIFNPIVDLEFGFEQMVAANVGLGLIAFVFYAFALAVGATTGRRGLTVGVSAAFTAATFFINGFAPLVEDLEWAQRLTPFFWLQEPNPLADGFAFGWFGLMLLVALALIAVAIVGFNRRDIDV